MTLELSNLWPMKPIREKLSTVFPDAKQERLDSTTLNLEIEDSHVDNLTDWLEEHNIQWRLV